jgi:nucleotide-binding universal stress UspA family protein
MGLMTGALVMERILVALDGSALSEAVLPLGETLARQYEAKLLLFRAIRARGFEALDPEEEMDLRAEAEEYLVRVAERLEHRGVPAVRWSVAQGKPEQAIVEAAIEHQVDLVAMTTHGRSGLARLLLGSVAGGLLRRAPVPVVLVRGQPAWKSGAIGAILVPLDGSGTSEGLLPVVERLAGPLDLTVHLLRVVELVPPFATLEMSARAEETLIEDRESLAERYLARIAKLLEAKGLRVRQAVRDGPVVKAIQAYVHEEQIGLVAMATHGWGRVRALLGTVPEAALREVSVPILLWRAPAEDGGGEQSEIAT